jgi:CheY-like chemotaxis protein/PAS domain-containing protein
VVSEHPSSPDQAPTDGASPERTKILYLSDPHGPQFDVRQRFGPDVDVVEADTALKAATLLGRSDFAGVFVDTGRLSESGDVGRLLQHDRIMQSMPDGVVLVDADGKILWGNGRIAEWTRQPTAVGRNFYQALGGPEILGPDFTPFHTALATRTTSVSTLRCPDNRYYQIHAAALHEGDAPPTHLVVTVHDVTDEVLQQQKLAAIHQSGTELADLIPDEVADLDYEQRVDLLKQNILHCMQDVLHLDVIEIRMLDEASRELRPLMAVGMEPAAEQRRLLAETEGNGVTGYVAATGKSYNCSNAADDPLFLEGAKGARSSLTVPLLLHDQVIGTLNVESPEIDAFTESDLQFLEIFARSVALALNTLELLAAQKACSAAASVEAIHSAVAMPIDDILNDAVNVMEHAGAFEPETVQRLQRILKHARNIKRVIQKVGQTMAPVEALPLPSMIELHPLLVGRRILFVDADETVRTSAHELLDRYQCFVETAHHGAEARSMVRNLAPEQYDMIFSDIRLPDMNGYELMMQLREVTDYVPLGLMAGFGYDSGHVITKAREKGLKFVVYKPLIPSQVIDAIEHTVEARLAEPVAAPTAS